MLSERLHENNGTFLQKLRTLFINTDTSSIRFADDNEGNCQVFVVHRDKIREKWRTWRVTFKSVKGYCFDVPQTIEKIILTNLIKINAWKSVRISNATSFGTKNGSIKLVSSLLIWTRLGLISRAFIEQVTEAAAFLRVIVLRFS